MRWQEQARYGWLPEGITHRGHAEHQVQVLLDSVHKGSLDGQLGGGPPLGLQDGPDDAGYLLQVLRPHQVGYLPTVEDVVDVLMHGNVDKVWKDMLC